MKARAITSTLFALALLAADATYRSVSIDKGGQLHIVLASGKEIAAPKFKDQVAFDNEAISPDRRTVGWLAMYPDPTITYYQGAQLAFRLVLYRAGRVLHSFGTQQTFWDWQFQDGGKRVAYSTGPTHGGAAECVLRDVESGKIVDQWFTHDGKAAPAWAATLRR